MKAGIYFTGTGPILLLTSYEDLNAPRLIEKMVSKGIKKFIAFEIDINKVRQRYGQQYQAILGDLRQTDDLRVRTRWTAHTVGVDDRALRRAAPGGPRSR